MSSLDSDPRFQIQAKTLQKEERCLVGQDIDACCAAAEMWQTRAPRDRGGNDVQQVYTVHPDRNGAWHCDGNPGFQLSSRHPGRYRCGRKPDRDGFLRLIKMIIAPLVFAT